MPNFIVRFLSNESATTAVEYAVLLALILIVAMTAILNLGTTNGGLWGGISTEITNGMPSGS
jgi:Flp pilus assembly pilin Flp